MNNPQDTCHTHPETAAESPCAASEGAGHEVNGQQLTEAVSKRIEDLGQIVAQMADVIRDRPLTSLGVAGGVGFLIGRILRRI